jgi:hypothetical protein
MTPNLKRLGGRKPLSAMERFEHSRIPEPNSGCCLLVIAKAIKVEAGVLKHHVLAEAADPRHGWSFPRRGIIHAPEGRTDRELYTLAHECAHVALRHDHRKPLWRREYEAELWAHAALQRHGIPVHEYDMLTACLNVFDKIEEAVERGKFGAAKAGCGGGGRVERLEFVEGAWKRLTRP